MEAAPETKHPHGHRTGAVADFIRRHNPWVMLAIPCVGYEIIGSVWDFLGRWLINDYLLQEPTPPSPLPVIIVTYILYTAAHYLYLRPVFRANGLRSKGEDVEPVLLLRARNRVYNFPVVLIMSTYGTFALSFGFVMLVAPEAREIFIVIGVSWLLVTMLNAILLYYLADILNRFYFIPHWFPDGRVRVSYKLRNLPTLFWRFQDLFLVNGVIPFIATSGVIYLTIAFGKHDAGEMERMLVTAVIVGGVFLFFGAILTFVTGRSFTVPLNSMSAAVRDLADENYDTRVVVQSDDQLGRLQGAFNGVADELREKNAIKTLFGHYVSPVVRDLILDGRIKTDGDRLEAAVLFSDIRSFTTLTEKHPPERIINLLNIHFSRIVGTVSDYRGFVDKFIGDAVMAVFDAEFCENEHRRYALHAALEIIDGLRETNRELDEMGFEPIRVGVGLACGTVIRGNIGAESRRELTVIGDIVNTASRLESVTREIGMPIVMTRENFEEYAAGLPGINTRNIKAMTLKGKETPIELMGVEPAAK